jgi:hypothetical protein
MAKSRKKIFPKPPEKLNSKNAKDLGKNSNKAGYDASLKAIYNQPEKVYTKPELSPQQQKMLRNLQKNLGFTYQGAWYE